MTDHYDTAPVMYDGLPFPQAFHHARQMGAAYFKWRGKPYSTETREEAEVKASVIPWHSRCGEFCCEHIGPQRWRVYDRRDYRTMGYYTSLGPAHAAATRLYNAEKETTT